MENRPIVAQPIANEGTTQCIDGSNVQASQKSPMGSSAHCTQLK